MGKTGRGRRPGGSGSDSSDGHDQKLYLQHPLLELRVPESEIVFLTLLPDGLDHNEWMASHTIGFFEHINLLYGTISEFCTPSTCPEMNGPGPRQYLWVDDKGKKSKLSAPQYIDYIMTFAQKTINDESIFPTKHGFEFPSSFDQQVRKLHRLLFHVMAHVYHAHFKEIVLLQLHAHLNALFAHFIEFNLRFRTVEDKELEVLNDLIVALRLVPPAADGGGGGVSVGGDAGAHIEDNRNDGKGSTPGQQVYSEENKENISSTTTSIEDAVICRQPTNSVEFPMPPPPSQQQQQQAMMETSAGSVPAADHPENCVEMAEDA